MISTSSTGLVIIIADYAKNRKSRCQKFKRQKFKNSKSLNVKNPKQTKAKNPYSYHMIFKYISNKTKKEIYYEPITMCITTRYFLINIDLKSYLFCRCGHYKSFWQIIDNRGKNCTCVRVGQCGNLECDSVTDFLKYSVTAIQCDKFQEKQCDSVKVWQNFQKYYRQY